MKKVGSSSRSHSKSAFCHHTCIYRQAHLHIHKIIKLRKETLQVLDARSSEYRWFLQLLVHKDHRITSWTLCELLSRCCDQMPDRKDLEQRGQF